WEIERFFPNWVLTPPGPYVTKWLHDDGGRAGLGFSRSGPRGSASNIGCPEGIAGNECERVVAVFRCEPGPGVEAPENPGGSQPGHIEKAGARAFAYLQSGSDSDDP